MKRETQKWYEQQQTQDQQQAIVTLEQELLALEAGKQQLQTEIQGVEKELPENLPASLADYVANGIQEGAYDQQLGLMHQVKADLTSLSCRLLPPPVSSITTKEFEQRMTDLQAVFPRGPARVVVFIDDLDCCPPDTVVEVLEAVQLLVKNPLFIAVLAIDERYINRALANHYRGVLSRHGRPSKFYYKIEKLCPLRDNMVPEASKEPGTRHLHQVVA